MSKLVIAVPNQIMVTQAENAARSLGVDATVLLENSRTVVESVKREREHGAAVAIARGNHANLLLHETDMPLVEIVLSGQNMAMLFSEARRQCEKENARIGLVGFRNMFGDTSTLAQVLGVNVEPFLANRTDELRLCTQKAAEAGVDIVIGGEIVAEEAEKLGLKHLFLHSTQDSIETAIAVAKRILYAIEMEKHNAAEFASLVNYSFDAVLKLDAQGNVAVSNYMAEKIFRRCGEALHGMHLSELIDLGSESNPISAAMRDKRSVYAITVKAGNQALIANFAAINVEGQNVGFILSLQEFQKIEDLEEQIRKERYSKGYVAMQTFDDLRTVSPVMREVKETAMKYARYDLPVMLIGEVGVGKRALAECIHNFSLRKRNPFVSVDCGGLSAKMQQTQFMGDGHSTKGAFEIAHTGTLLIEHVSMLDEYCQYQLLHVLKHSCLVGLDGRMMLPVNIRVICTTGKDLYQCVRDGKFLEPLYCMLTQLELLVPPLCERAEDLPALLDMTIEKYSTHYRKYVHLLPEARELIYAQPWGGNILQLSLFCEKLLILADDKQITGEFVRRHLPRSFAPAQQSTQRSLPMVVHSEEEAQLIEALEKHGGSRSLAAEALGVSKTTLWRRMKKFGIAEKYR